MLICGIKVTHDGGIALIDGNKLLFSIEAEKIGNGHRYSSLGSLERMKEILASQGVDMADVDRFVIDGWWVEPGETAPSVTCPTRGRTVKIDVAPYTDVGGTPALQRYTFTTDALTGGRTTYSSYHHTTGHIMATYCSSPFAVRSEDALVLVWDGGTVPRLYEVSGREKSARIVRPLMTIVGNTFADFARIFEPFAVDTTDWDPDDRLRHNLGIAGKAMAFAALGSVTQELFPYFDKAIDHVESEIGVSVDVAGTVALRTIADRQELFPGLTNADFICTMQAYLGSRLLTALRRTVSRHFPGQTPNLAMTGGCALNIKWNRLIRDSGLFRELWVPPFPNDSGAPIGAAAAEMFATTGHSVLDWQVYSGPGLTTTGTVQTGWTTRPCDEAQLGALLHEENEPVVVLSGRAELGPRALGNRSILAAATSQKMKTLLNDIKGREDYRPVAPLCLESAAPQVFAPGTVDPYMLFEQAVRPEWVERIPAVMHLDGTARLQTITPEASSAGRILAAYERLSGIPVLCNTSANLNGRGFFPDVESATRWGRTRYVWSEGTLYVQGQSHARALTSDARAVTMTKETCVPAQPFTGSCLAAVPSSSRQQGLLRHRGPSFPR